MPTGADHELTDEQSLLAESVGRLLDRDWPGPGQIAGVPAGQRARVWDGLLALGLLDIGGQGLGAAELCLVGRALGQHLASVPFLGSAAIRLALAPLGGGLPAGLASLAAGPQAVGLALLEPGRGWAADPAVPLVPRPGGAVIHGQKVAVEQLVAAEVVVVSGAVAGQAALAVTPVMAAGLLGRPQAALDETVLMSTVRFDAVPAVDDCVLSGPAARYVLDRLLTGGALLAAAEASGAAAAVLDLACQYAGTRRQFGHAIGSFQAVRHLLADAYVRQASGWSAVRYAAAALDSEDPGADQAVSVAKAYVSRGAREVAHTAMQVFGGIAFTAEHPAHRFLRRISVRAQQFGDAAQHERRLGRALADRALAAGARAVPAEAVCG